VIANSLNVALVESIRSLFAQGWSRRRIARELGVDRETVGKYVLEQSCGQNPPNLPTGSEGPKPANLAGLPAPEPAESDASKPATTRHHLLPNRPACEPLRELIPPRAGRATPSGSPDWAVTPAASATTACGGPFSVWVAPARCRSAAWNAPGEEAQVDFRTGPILPEGKRRKTDVDRAKPQPQSA
jgi:hypothetical protein